MFRGFSQQCLGSIDCSRPIESQIFHLEIWQEDPNHNMCSRKNNKPSATCAAADGPVSVDSCPGWFAALWAEQKEWVTRLLPKSQATWQIAVTHFPCGHEQGEANLWGHSVKVDEHFLKDDCRTLKLQMFPQTLHDLFFDVFSHPKIHPSRVKWVAAR